RFYTDTHTQKRGPCPVLSRLQNYLRSLTHTHTHTHTHTQTHTEYLTSLKLCCLKHNTQFTVFKSTEAMQSKAQQHRFSCWHAQKVLFRIYKRHAQWNI